MKICYKYHEISGGKMSLKKKYHKKTEAINLLEMAKD
jgi:hypothetical protein